jgi:hypothetical protein
MEETRRRRRRLFLLEGKTKNEVSAKKPAKNTKEKSQKKKAK